MVTYIKSDLDFILAQIKIAEAHAGGQPLYGPGGLIPTYNLAWGLRTVNGEYNNLLHPEWGSADNPFPEPLGNDYRPAAGTPLDMDGPGGQPPVPTAPNYNPSNSPNNIVVDGSVRTISNLLVDQTLDNPAAIMVALERAGVTLPAGTTLLELAVTIKAEYQVVKPFLEVAEDAHLDNVNAQRTLVSAQQAFNNDPSPANQTALDDAIAAAATTQAASDAADLALAGARVNLDAMLTDNGITMDGDNISLPNIAPDEGLSAPFNSWFTLFGQFFDHGLDLVGKGGSGTVFIPLQPDDPLYDPASPTNFMVLTRATVLAGPDNVMNTADDIRPINTTTPFVDQNQTYTSHASHQVFLREYILVGGRPQATGNLLDGANGGLPTWGEVKAQAREMLGIDLTDYHVGNLPLLATDEYGNFLPNPTTGFPQVVMVGPPQTLASGTPGAPLSLVTVGPDGPDQGTLPDVTHLAVRTGHAFLDDIAHTAVPVGKLADGDIEVGLANPANGSTEYDNELLDAHFVTGDGRGNENIGLTTVHHVFHSEHNRLMDHTKDVVLATNDIAFINEWLDLGITALTEIDTQVERDALKADVGRWDGERLFQAAKFGTEMQYQHLVFEEFARKIQPNINVFLVPDGYDVTIDPTILAEFAHVVYRFGHSMLTETIDRFDPTFTSDHIGLIEGFLNPLEFASQPSEEMAGAVIRGMTRQVGNHIDEFVTSALRNNLLGLPLDLATINLARGRDTGVPSLNEARRQFYDATGNDAILKPYESWVEFASHLKHEASIINFIAAYGTHTLITGETTVEGKRDAAITLILGEAFGKFADPLLNPPFVMPADRDDFLNGTGAYGAAGALGGLENVDLWIGGLAEAITPFGGMLGSTFNFVFEAQMEKLQNGDRFYYLQRLDGLHLFGEMEGNSFAAMIMRNTDATHLPSDVFSTPGLILEIDRTKQYNPGLGETAGADNIMDDDPTTLDVNEAADNIGNDPEGGGLLNPLVIRNNPATVGPDSNYLRYTGTDHVLLGGTDNADILIAGIGDDTLFGDGGNDNLEGGHGNDIINAGDGDDIIRDMGGDDNIKGGDGNDAIHAGPGLDLVMGGRGQDFVVLGTDMGSEVFAGEGNDFIFGNKNAERILGNEGDDWIETGTFDGAPGDNFDEIFAHDGIDGNDVFLGDGGFDEFIGEGGDDIMVGSPGRGKMAGMSGFDWATYKDAVGGINADLSVGIVFDESPVLPPNTALDEFESMEGLSGSAGNDVLAGSNEDATTRLPLAQGGSTGYLGSALDAQGIALINGLQAVLGAGVTAFSAGDIILGGDGSDVITGRGGDDIIDGDKWLDVQIGVFDLADVNHTGTPTRLVKSMKELTNEVFAGTINPGQLSVVRTIRTDTTAGDIDTAKYVGLRSEYAFSATADGQVIVTHAVPDGVDGSDRLRNIERVEFADANPLNIIVGTPFSDNGLPPQGAGPLNQPALNGTAQDDLILGLAGADVLNGNGGNDILVGGANGTAASSTTTTFADNFDQGNNNNNNGSANFASNWVELGDFGGTTSGQIRLDDGTNALRFYGGTPAGDYNGAQITRTMNLSSATSATIAYSANPDLLDAGETVTVQFAANGTTFVNLQVISGDGGATNYSHTVTGPFTANAAIRFVTTAINAAGEGVSIDNLAISYSTVTQVAGVDVLNGGLGDDTYSFGVGDGNDTINEAVNATSGGSADRISILAPSTGVDVDGLPILTIDALNANDSNTATANGDLVINYTLPTGTTQTITVAGHFAGADAQTGVERINFNGALYAGYVLGADDYMISRSDPANRDAGGVNMSTNAVTNNQANFVVGENGVNDVITGGLLNDLIFGGTGDNDLFGGDGDDLLVGGSAAGDDDLLDGGLGADTMVGLAGNDTYVVDDVADVIVEAAAAGTDTVQTALAALSIELVANVENLTYTGVDADQFVGTGNSLNNVITGGDLADTLSGLGGNDELDGGIGADSMTGGDGNDVYDVDDVGDVVIETNADALIGGVDRVESDVDYVLGANVENLDLNGAAVSGTGNALNNIINGNGDANQLFGGGGDDTINGAGGTDLLDGGIGNDTLNGGAGVDTIIGGAGNDTINVNDGNDVIVYNATGFGADIITNFDAAGGAGNQDLINLSALGITAANLATRVIESTVAGNTLLTVRDASLATIGTIQINGVTNANIDATDYILAAAAPAPFGAATTGPNTITGNAAANLIDGLAGNDTLSGAGGDDVIIGGEGTDTLNGGDGNDTLTGGAGSNTGAYVDNFGAASYTNNNGTIPFAAGWTESGAGEATNATAGDIQIAGGRLRFGEGIDGDEIIQRSINLTGATAASLSFTYEGDDLDAGESVAVEAFNGTAWQLLGTLGGDTNGNANFTAPLTAAHTAIRLRAVGTYEAGENFYVDNFTVNATIPGLNAGVDTINGDAGDDTIVWNANTVAPTDGRDVVDGGTEGAAGDTFVINGNASAETYRIYSRAAFLGLNPAAVLLAATEIVVTRNGEDAASVIAELSEIEEIRVNGADPSGNGSSGGDAFEVIGDFSGTNLRLNTITIDGDAGDDTIDISALSSAHRIVFRSNGGHDTIIGTLRPEDVIELPDGATAADYDETVVDGVTTLTKGNSSITYTAAGEGPQVGNGDDDDEDEDDEDEDDDDDVDHDDDDDDDCDTDDDDDDDGAPAPSGSGHLIGTPMDDVLIGTSAGDLVFGYAGTDYIVTRAGADVVRAGAGDDLVNGEAGRDMLFGEGGDDDLFGGDDDDMIDGGIGDDRLFGQNGNDLLEAGAGDDSVFGGNGNDMIVASLNDGNDTYYGGDISEDTGIDTLDMGFLTVDVDVDLGTGVGGRGSAVSSQSGTDTLWGVENVVTGSGDDTITMTNAVNVVDGGQGEDVFIFGSAAAAHGDTIRGFEAGDKIDLSGIDANAGTAGNDTFTLTSGPTTPGQIVVTHETREDGEYTVISGDIAGTNAPEFRISIAGNHTLTGDNFNL